MFQKTSLSRDRRRATHAGAGAAGRERGARIQTWLFPAWVPDRQHGDSVGRARRALGALAVREGGPRFRAANPRFVQFSFAHASRDGACSIASSVRPFIRLTRRASQSLRNYSPLLLGGEDAVRGVRSVGSRRPTASYRCDLFLVVLVLVVGRRRRRCHRVSLNRIVVVIVVVVVVAVECLRTSLIAFTTALSQVCDGPDRGVYKCAMSVGWNPQFDDLKEKTIEAWLLHDFDDEFYDSTLRLVILASVRPQAKFDSFDELIAEIRADGVFCSEALDHPDLQSCRDDPFFFEGDAHASRP